MGERDHEADHSPSGAPSEAPERRARALALARVSRRESSAAEVELYLRRKGIDESVCREIISALVQEGLIDDERFARAFAREQSCRGKGPLAILAKLRAKGVRLDLRRVRELYEESAPSSELERARALVARRYPAAQGDLATSRRAYQALLRRGFSAAIARQCVSEEVDE